MWDTVSSAVILRGDSGYLRASASGRPKAATGAAGNPDATARVWDAATGKELLTLSSHRRHVIEALALESDGPGRRLATGSEDRTAKVWRPATGKELFQLYAAD